MPMAAKIMWNPSEISIWMRAAMSEDIGVSPLYRARYGGRIATAHCLDLNDEWADPGRPFRGQASRSGDQNAAAPASATA